MSDLIQKGNLNDIMAAYGEKLEAALKANPIEIRLRVQYGAHKETRTFVSLAPKGQDIGEVARDVVIDEYNADPEYCPNVAGYWFDGNAVSITYVTTVSPEYAAMKLALGQD